MNEPLSGAGLRDAVIRNAAVLDGTGREPGERMDVLVRDGRIAAIQPAGTKALPVATLTIDGTGCTLLPGLTDAHIHLALIGPRGDHGTGRGCRTSSGCAP